jgi:hypothetical protein
LGIWNAWGRGEIPAGFWWGNLKGRHNVKGLGIVRSRIKKWILKEEV